MAACDESSPVQPDHPVLDRDVGGIAENEVLCQHRGEETEQGHFGLRERRAPRIAKPADAVNDPGAEARQGHPILGAVAGHDLEQGSDRLGFVGFEVDAHRYVRKRIEGLRETRHRVAVEIVTSRTGRDVPLSDLVEGDGANVLGNTGHPLSIRIVGDHEVAVGGGVDVNLERVGAVGQRPLEGRQGVLRQVRGSPAMTVETESVLGSGHPGPPTTIPFDIMRVARNLPGRSFGLPVFEVKAHDSLELARVVGDKYELVGNSGSRDEEIVGPDRYTTALELAADGAVDLGAAIVESKRRKDREEAFNQTQVLGLAGALSSTEVQLGLDDRAQRDLCRRARSESPLEGFRGAVENPNAGVRVEEVHSSKGVAGLEFALRWPFERFAHPSTDYRVEEVSRPLGHDVTPYDLCEVAGNAEAMLPCPLFDLGGKLLAHI